MVETRFPGLVICPPCPPEPGVTVPKRPVPLESVNASITIVDMIAEVTITQTYKNKEEKEPIEAVYTFPLHESAAVTRFAAEIDGRIIEGRVEEKEKAQKEYEEALNQGHGAMLFEEQLPDVFHASIGNILPGQTITTRISFLMEVRHDAEHDSARFVLPTFIAPRYGTPSSSATHEHDRKTELSTGEFAFTLEAKVKMSGDLQSIESPSHPISVRLGKGGEATVSLSQDNVKVDKDFVLVINAEGLDRPRAFVETHPEKGTKCVMLTMTPRFSLREVRSELIFVIDRSGSMSERNKIRKAKEALTLFLRSLPSDCYFNIISFGSDYSSLYSESAPYSESTLNSAIAHVSSMDADMGGTEIHPALQFAFSKRRKDVQTTVFVLTDGEVWNVEEVFQGIKKASKDGARLFGLGVGDDVSHHLVEGAARAGKGYAQFVGDNERMEKKVIQMLRNSLQPPVSDYQVAWVDSRAEIGKEGSSKQEAEGSRTLSFYEEKREEGGKRVKKLDMSVCQAPADIPVVVPGSRLTVFAVLKQNIAPLETITLRGQAVEGPIELSVPVTKAPDGRRLHTMAARKLIQDLEESLPPQPQWDATEEQRKQQEAEYDGIRAEVVEVAKAYSLASKFTSFIAVDTKTRSEVKLKTRVVVPGGGIGGYGYVGGSGGGFAPPMASASFAPRSKMLRSAAPMMCYAAAAPAAPPGFGGFGMTAEASFEEAPDMAVDSFSAPPPPAPQNKRTSEEEADDEALPPKPNSIAALHNLVALQSFQGSFPPSDKLSKRLNLASAESLEVPSDALQSVTEEAAKKEVWSTACALALLRLRMAELQDAWELVERKAIKWIEGKGVQAEKIVAEAEKAVAAWLEK
ncbi:uncharacterized protein VTP21DRAFT_7740 [Calcarisporiella thermophila]|uniref:uncharacterized protein n=1 Tax=Calcarisporiella thermophila TaxID=911321 RepID=UPI0037423816